MLSSRFLTLFQKHLIKKLSIFILKSFRYWEIMNSRKIGGILKNVGFKKVKKWSFIKKEKNNSDVVSWEWKSKGMYTRAEAKEAPRGSAMCPRYSPVAAENLSSTRGILCVGRDEKLRVRLR